MTNRLNVLHEMCPKLRVGPLVEIDELAEFISQRSSLNRGTIKNVLCGLQDAIVHFVTVFGRSVKLEEIGSFIPVLKLSGKLKLHLRVDPVLTKRANNTHLKSLDIKNRKNIGKSLDQLVKIWNELHPDAPVTD